jgi:CRP-like cAMP-binding protein
MSVPLPPIHGQGQGKVLGHAGVGLGIGDDMSVSSVDTSMQSTATPIQHNPQDQSHAQSQSQGQAQAQHKHLFEIDFVGNESYVTSQRNVLLKRSDEPFAINFEAKLSARGLHHRSRNEFQRELKESTNIIVNSLKEDKGAKKGNKPKAQLLQPYFQRALAFERLNQIPRAMQDYDKVLAIDNKTTSAWFNRSNLNITLGNVEQALSDLNAAIALDPMNLTYRNNKARILRSQGDYMAAIQETMVHRAIETQPEFMRAEFDAGREPNVDSSGLKRKALPKDPILVVLAQPKGERKKKHLACVVDFISNLKFFQAFKNEPEILNEIAAEVELTSYEKGQFIFEEGMLGEHFYIIMDGEVSIVKCKKKEDGEIVSTNVLVRLFRGYTFGETALEKKGGVRSAGALASQPTHLLSLHVDIYSKIVQTFKAAIRAEVRLVLSNCPAFSELNDEALTTLATNALVRSYTSNKEILKAGEKSKYLFIVKHGLVKIIKKLKRPKVSHIKVFSAYSGKVQKPETPGLWVLEKSYTTPLDSGGVVAKRSAPAKDGNGTKKASSFGFENEAETSDGQVLETVGPDETEFTVGVIASGQIFGELAVLNPGELSPTTAITSTACEVFCLDGEAVLKLGAKYSQKCMAALTEGVTLHNPPAEKLSYFFRAKYVEEKQMKGMLALMKTTH